MGRDGSGGGAPENRTNGYHVTGALTSAGTGDAADMLAPVPHMVLHRLRGDEDRIVGCDFRHAAIMGGAASQRGLSDRWWRVFGGDRCRWWCARFVSGHVNDIMLIGGWRVPSHTRRSSGLAGLSELCAKHVTTSRQQGRSHGRHFARYQSRACPGDSQAHTRVLQPPIIAILAKTPHAKHAA
jgi:hypothetical protein